MRIHLVDQLATATKDAPGPAHVSIQSITIARESRTCIFQHPDSRVTFPSVTLPPNAVAHFGCAIKDTAWTKINSAVRFRISIQVSGSKQTTIWERSIDARNKAERRWHDFTIDLKAFARKTVSFILETLVPEGADGQYCWSAWSDPLIEFAENARAKRPPARRSTRHRNLLLLTSDALRADFIGCYGHPFVKTPNIDALAKEGVLFADARSQSSTTPGSYASLLTGLYGPEHGVMAEWGKLNPQIVTLPTVLATHGYNTLIAASEAELVDAHGGFLKLFQDSIQCLAVPAQAGDLTARQFCQWLERRPDGPFFAWVQFFDTHPPSNPPVPFNRLYYQNDPTDPLCEYSPEKIDLIRGVESVLRIRNSIKQFKEGKVDIDIAMRLRHTAEVYLGLRDEGPDLVHHLRALGPEARRGMDVPEFAHWLMERVERINDGLQPDLIDWLEDVLARLIEVEADILSWLRDVVDFRYAMAQYQSGVTFLDHNIGTIIESLKEQGIYDETTILFTSPHGELLDEEGLHFHHHAVFEPVLHIPCILKPGSHSPVPRGTRVQGVFDQIDMASTVLDVLGVPDRLGHGCSRVPTILANQVIPEHDSFSVDLHGATVALRRGEFVMVKALESYFISPLWNWTPGDKRLACLTRPMNYKDDLVEKLPTLAASMEKAIDEFVATWKERSTPTVYSRGQLVQSAAGKAP